MTASIRRWPFGAVTDLTDEDPNIFHLLFQSQHSNRCVQIVLRLISQLVIRLGFALATRGSLVTIVKVNICVSSSTSLGHNIIKMLLIYRYKHSIRYIIYNSIITVKWDLTRIVYIMHWLCRPIKCISRYIYPCHS